MSEARRKRVDVSVEAHAWLETEARRQGLAVRDLVDRIVRGTMNGDGRSDLPSPQTQGRAGHDAEVKRQGDRLGIVIERFDTFVVRLTKELPLALNAGFDGIKETIRNTGGTGHLRDMLAELDKKQTARLKEMEAGQKAAKGELLAEIRDRLGGKLTALNGEVLTLNNRLKQWRWAFGAGAISAAVLLLALSFVLADTTITRWYAVRLTGASDKVMAAATLVGNGQMAAPLMTETAGLLQDSRFRETYARCVSQAKAQTRLYSTCRIMMPIIKTVD